MICHNVNWQLVMLGFRVRVSFLCLAKMLVYVSCFLITFIFGNIVFNNHILYFRGNFLCSGSLSLGTSLKHQLKSHWRF